VFFIGFYKMLILAKVINFGMSKLKIFLLILLATLMITHGCRKHDDFVSPDIVFLSPAENTLFVANMLEVSIKVTAERPLKSIRISLVNDDHIPVLTPAYFLPKTNDTIIHFEFNWNDQFESGGYYLQVLADDGRKEKFKYQRILIAVQPNEMADLYYVTGNSSSTILWRLAENSVNAEVLLNQSQQITQLGSGRGNLYLMTTKPSKLLAHSASDGNRQWEKEAGMPAGTFNHFYLAGNHLLVADASGTISMLNATTGVSQLTAHHQPDTIPTKVFFDEDYIYVAQLVYPGGHYLFSVFYRATAAFYKRYKLDGAVAGIFQYGVNKVLVATVAEDGKLGFSFWDKASEQWIELGELHGHLIRQLRHGLDGLLLMVSDKGVGFINPASGSFNMVYEGAGFTDAIVQPFDGQIAAAQGSIIRMGSTIHQTAGHVLLLGYALVGQP
jgi:hypothetical protein